MEHNRRRTDTWSHWVKDLTALITAVTALIVALSAAGFSFHNKERLDKHKEEIESTAVKVEDNTKTLEQHADAINAAVGAPVAAPPLEAANKKD